MKYDKSEKVIEQKLIEGREIGECTIKVWDTNTQLFIDQATKAISKDIKDLRTQLTSLIFYPSSLT